MKIFKFLKKKETITCRLMKKSIKKSGGRKNADIVKVNFNLKVNKNVTYIDSAKYLYDNKKELDMKFSVGDGIHLNKEGYRNLELALREYLK